MANDITKRKKVHFMYVPKANTGIILGTSSLFLGFTQLLSSLIVFFVLLGILLILFSLKKDRIAIEPTRHPNGSHQFAVTKNGKPIRWLRNNKK